MKKAKQTLTAALAATLATGALGTVAGASPLDDAMKIGFNAMEKARSEKTQTAINEARVAINAMPKELDWAKGEFSKQVDQVQQPIYTQIIDLIEKGKKEAKQETVNEGRKLLVGVEDAYAKTWSSDFDTIQQTLVNNATEAVKAATKSQKAEDITKAEALVAELKTSENADVKKSVEGMEKDLKEKIDIRVTKVEVTNATTIQVTLSKDVDSDSLDTDKFVIKNGTIRNYVKKAELVSGKKDVVELTLQSKLDENKKYEVTVSGIKDVKGGILKSSTTEVKYDKKEVASVEFTSKKLVRNSNVRNMILVKDEAGRDITKEAKLTFECSTDKDIVTKDGKISGSVKIGKEVNVRVYSGDKIFAEQMVTVSENGAENLLGFTVSKVEVDEDTKFADITPSNKIKVGTSGQYLTVFYKDTLGNEKNVTGAKLKKVESLNTNILSVTSGKLNAKKEGVATLKVQYGDMTEEIQVEVVNSSIETATLSMEETSINVAKSNVENRIEFKLKDNASGEEVKPSSVEVKVYRQTVSKWENVSGVSADKDNKVVKVNGQYLPEGDTAAKLIVTYNGVKYEQEFNINVDGAEKIDSYKLVAEDDKGLQTEDLNEKDGDEAKLKLYAIDENGNRVAYTGNAVRKVELYKDGEFQTELKEKELKDGYKIDSTDIEIGSHQYYVIVHRADGEKQTNEVTITTENTDRTGSFNIYQNTTTGTTLGSLVSWAYGKNDYGKNDSTDVLKVVGSISEGENIKVKYNGDLTTLEEAFKHVINSKDDAGSELKKIKFIETGFVRIKIDEVKVKNSDGKIRRIHPDTYYPITIGEEK